MTHIYTRENRHGDWWCNGTIQGYDYSFEATNIPDARNKMQELLAKKQIPDSDVKWYEPTNYPKQEAVVKSEIGYATWRIDKGMV